MWNIIYLGPVVTVQCPKTISNLSNSRCRPRSRVGKMWKCKIWTRLLSISKANILVCRDLRYQTHWCSGHGSVPRNNEQPFKFCVSNSAQKAQFCKCSLNRQCCDGHKGPNSAISVTPIMSWRVFQVLAKMGYWGQIRDSKFKNLPNVDDHCTETASRTRVTFQTPADKYTGLITD